MVNGDFNTTPDSPTVKEILNYNGGNFKSLKTFDVKTTYKVREKESYKMIDYIFYDKGELKVVEDLGMVPKDVIGENGLPHPMYPSDH